MKRNLYFLITLLVVVAACGGDDSDPVADRIIGTWTERAFITENCDSASDNETFSLPCDSVNCFKYIINSDQSIIEWLLSNGDTTIDTNYYFLVSENIEICESDVLGSACINYVLQEDKDILTLTIESDEDGCDVVREFEKD